MKGHGNATVLALLDMTAIGAKHRGIEASPVEEKNALLTVGISLSQGFDQWLGKNRRNFLALALPPHVNEVNQGEFPTVYAFTQR